jgi:hypothetical protein
VEGLYRTGTGRTDWSVRLGMLEPGGIEPTSVLGGLEFRSRVIDHTTDWPLDGAVVFGAGGSFASGHSVMNIPAGLSLGRRINFEDSQITVTPYVQPTAFLHGGDNLPTQFLFGMGVGADLRLSGTFDVRAGAGLGDIRGLSLGAVWVH